jgi:hypothetical protein
MKHNQCRSDQREQSKGITMTNEKIKAYASSLGYEFTDEDCADIIGTSYEGETVEHAVNDFLDAFER